MVARARGWAVLAGVLVALAGGGAHAAAPTATAIAVGGYHACALYSDGTVKCWGRNTFGQLGDGTTTDRPTAVAVPGLSGVKAIAAGGNHTCALTNAGGVKCWGTNLLGEVGDGTATDRHAPVDVSGLTSGVQAISSGGDVTCALLADTTVKCWGDGGSGQLGNAGTQSSTLPVSVLVLAPPAFITFTAFSTVQSIVAGGGDVCAFLPGSLLNCWGNNFAGQLADGTKVNRSLPAQLSGFWTTAGIGNGTMCAVSSFGGATLCWGSGQLGALGNGTTTDSKSPVDVTGLGSGTNVKQLALGEYFGCALTSANGVKCWGYNAYGQLGDGTTTNRTTPVDVTGLASGVQAIDAGTELACALLTGGVVRCWGRNDLGQLGNGTTTDSSSPVVVKGAGSQTLTVAKSGNGSGSVTSSPGGIDCGSTCSNTFSDGSSVVLTATPASGSTFAGWSGDCGGSATTCTLTMSANHSATGSFAQANTPPPPPPPPSPVPTPTTTITTTTPAPAATACVVPKLVKKKQAAAITAIAKSGCKLAALRYGFSRGVKKGLVIWQSPKAGSKPKKPLVTILVSRGKKR